MEHDHELAQCALRNKLVLPVYVGCSVHLVREDLDGGPICTTQKVSDYVAQSKQYGDGKLARWEVMSIELNMDSDSPMISKPHRFNPPANTQLNLGREQQWWHDALRACAGLVCSVQQVQFAKAPRSFAKWDQLPLIIWAKPWPTNTVTSTEGGSRELESQGARGDRGDRGDWVNWWDRRDWWNSGDSRRQWWETPGWG